MFTKRTNEDPAGLDSWLLEFIAEGNETRGLCIRLLIGPEFSCSIWAYFLFWAKGKKDLLNDTERTDLSPLFVNCFIFRLSIPLCPDFGCFTRFLTKKSIVFAVSCSICSQKVKTIWPFVFTACKLLNFQVFAQWSAPKVVLAMYKYSVYMTYEISAQSRLPLKRYKHNVHFVLLFVNRLYHLWDPVFAFWNSIFLNKISLLRVELPHNYLWWARISLHSFLVGTLLLCLSSYYYHLYKVKITLIIWTTRTGLCNIDTSRIYI